MKRNSLAALALIATAIFLSPLSIAEPVRDCVLEGTVKERGDDPEKVHVVFHSYRSAEKGAPCRIRRSEKLQFKSPVGSGIEDVPAGSKVEYRYTEDSDAGSKWELRRVSERSPI